MSEEPYIVVGAQTARKLARPSRRRWILPLAGLTVLAGGIVAGALVLSSSPSGSLVAVKRGDIIHSFVSLGRVESDSTIAILSKVTAHIETIHVREGDVVRKGAPLVTLYDRTLDAQYTEAVQTREMAKARWDEIRRGTRSEDVEHARAQVREAEEAWKSADARLREVRRGARPEAKRDAEAKLAKAKIALAFRRSEWDRVKNLSEDDIVSRRERDQVKRNLETAEATLREMQAHRDRVVNGSTEEEKAQARAAVGVAQARLDQAKARLSRLVNGATPEERRVAQAELERAKATVARLEAQRAELKIVAPLNAVVLRRYYEPGELAHPQMRDPILVLGDADRKTIRIEVIENDIYKIRKGEETVITSDSYPGRSWKGTISRVAPVLGQKRLSTQNPKEKSDVKVLEVWITPSEAMDLPLNLPIEARIYRVIRKDVLVLPARAVDPAGYVLSAGKDRKKVRLGARDDTYVEILSGLTEGERVRLAP